MKQITYIILAAMLLLCGGFGYERLMADRDTDMNRKGELSDIAESVTAIPLKPINGKSLTDAHDIQKDGNDLFLICQGILYRFNRQGELVCQITQPEEIKVAGYLVHSLKKQLIVLGNVDDIYYYTFDGELLFKKKLRKDFNEEQLLSAVLYKGKIYTAERVIEKDTLHRTCVKQQVQVYDTCFQPLESHPIVEVSLTHPVLFPNLQSVRLYRPIVEKCMLIRHLISRNIYYVIHCLFIKREAKKILKTERYRYSLFVWEVVIGWLPIRMRRKQNNDICFAGIVSRIRHGS